ncbi:MAG TPA: ATP-binding cassette domain-containing protein [Campylobacterales bacterium]|nr:ATP-binding cassette domain-containing protein [Campylobacterales bacterium]
MLTIDNVHYEYHDSELYDFSMSVGEGEIVAILGQSGSGKSTLLDLIAGFMRGKSGTIALDGAELITLSVEARPLTILFQNHNLFEHLSVQKNILLGISKTFKSSHEDIEKVKTILKEVGLEKFEHKLASSLSGGQQQRVALARALIRQKPILLLDEPFTGLDMQTRVHMLELVKKISTEKNLHTIMVTHEQQDCDLIADRVYRVENYRLVAQ